MIPPPISNILAIGEKSSNRKNSDYKTVTYSLLVILVMRGYFGLEYKYKAMINRRV